MKSFSRNVHYKLLLTTIHDKLKTRKISNLTNTPICQYYIYRGIKPCIPYGPSSLNVGSGGFPRFRPELSTTKRLFLTIPLWWSFPRFELEGIVANTILYWQKQPVCPVIVSKQDPYKLSRLKSKPLLGHLDHTGLFWLALLNILFFESF